MIRAPERSEFLQPGCQRGTDPTGNNHQAARVGRAQLSIEISMRFWKKKKKTSASSSSLRFVSEERKNTTFSLSPVQLHACVRVCVPGPPTSQKSFLFIPLAERKFPGTNFFCPPPPSSPRSTPRKQRSRRYSSALMKMLIYASYFYRART